MNILHIDSSISGANSVSRQLTASIVRQLTGLAPGAAVIYLDLSTHPVPQLGPGLLAAKMAGADDADAAASAAALAAFMAADVIVVGAPMYNFSIPSQLKAWIDSICVAGVTFSYSAAGPVGLCKDKRVIIASARGNVFSAPSPNAALDHQENYLRGVFGFLGIEQVEVIRAEGVAFGAEPRRLAMDAAMADVDALTA